MKNIKTFRGRKDSFIVVTGNDGEEYICPKSALRKFSSLSEEERRLCVSESRTFGGSAIGG